MVACACNPSSRGLRQEDHYVQSQTWLYRETVSKETKQINRHKTKKRKKERKERRERAGKGKEKEKQFLL